MKNAAFILLISMISIVSCTPKKNNPVKVLPQRQQPKAITYTFVQAKQWLSANTTDSAKLQLAYAVNRTDKAGFAKMDSVIIPDDMSGDIDYYMHFPLEADYLRDINKIIFFSYPSQTFATYENGILLHSGPTNMGRKNDPTPTGLFYTNWKAEKTTSTFNDEWELLWNFNIANKEGVGWHQYELPGYPASHSCLRLQEKDARYLYNWADEWEMKGTDIITVKGTPVIVFGSYPFDAPKPWLQLITNPNALDISAAELQKQTAAHLNEILAEQKKRVMKQDSKQ